jgi:hypothetical protein
MIMSDRESEACGRCSMSTVVDTVADEEAAERDPFGEDRIEVEEEELQRVSPDAWIARFTTRLNEIARWLTYGR